MNWKTSTRSWLLEHEPDARQTCSPGELGRLIDAVVGREADDATLTLLSHYRDVASVDALLGVVQALPVERRDVETRALVDRYLVRMPGDPRLLRVAADLALSAGDTSSARALLDRLARADSGPGTVRYVARARAALPATGEAPVRIALLSSFTVDPLVPYIDLECRALGLGPEIYLAPFNSWNQEILSPTSGLRNHDPEITILAVSIDDLAPQLAGAPTAAELDEVGRTAVERVLAAARRWADWSSGLLIVHSFCSVFASPGGPVAARSGPSYARWLAGLNARLAEGLAGIHDAYLLDLPDMLARRPGGAWDNPTTRHLAAMRLPDGALSTLAHVYAGYVSARKGLTRKCVVLDLDNTLWGGVVGEDGPHGIKLGDTAPGSEYREFQRYLASLTARGILLAVASKNNVDDALEVIRDHEGMILREQAFSALRINWRPKPENLQSLAEELGLGLDSFVFVDDNPDERAMMRQMLPQVLTVELPQDPGRYREVLSSLPQLQTLTVTEEDQARVEMYQAKRERDQLRDTAQTLDEYLASLEVVADIGPADEATLPRIHQLFHRTNQFNLTTRRYEPAQLAGFSEHPDWRLYVMRARDRFGDHGLVATALVHAGPDAWRVDSLLMSCRVIGYGLETTLLARICEEARDAGARSLLGEFIATKKNVPAKDFYDRHGFVRDESSTAEVVRFRLGLDQGGVSRPPWVAENAAHVA